MIPQAGIVRVTPSTSKNRRRAGRLHGVEGRTSIGAIMDLSATGVRVRCGMVAPRQGVLTHCTIETPEGSINVRARVAWRRRLGLIHNEVGLEFVDLNKKARAALGALAQTALGVEPSGSRAA
ncbi:MAG: PilZ domain-containing protein [Phycisphaerae bacterium]|nr:PilZ domain-containing protein [Phycisphaerae bacterium]